MRVSKKTKGIISLAVFLIITGLALLQSSPKTNPVPSPSATSVHQITESTKSATAGIEGEKVLVTKVIDGDTIEIESGQSVRFVGIDTPETVDPRRPVGCFGKEASNETKRLLTGKEVILQKDVSDTDKYKRLLRYIYLPLENGQILFVNDYLVREGFARVYTYSPDVKFNQQFLEAEREARENQRGLWKSC